MTGLAKRVISGTLVFDVDEQSEAMMFVAAFVARSRQEGWNVDDIHVTIIDEVPT